jgi:hypothetical protein
MTLHNPIRIQIQSNTYILTIKINYDHHDAVHMPSSAKAKHSIKTLETSCFSQSIRRFPGVAGAACHDQPLYG